MTNEARLRDDAARYAVELTHEAMRASQFVKAKSDIAKIRKMLRILDTVPEIGRVYDPDYGAATPPFQARVTYAGRYGIYYTVDEDAKVVTVFAIEDQRANPLNHFYGIYPHEAR